jgi:hypothetical protein
MLRPPLRFRPAMLSPSGKHSLSSGFPHTMHHEETVRDEKDEKCRRSQEFAVKSENAERKGENNDGCATNNQRLPKVQKAHQAGHAMYSVSGIPGISDLRASIRHNITHYTLYGWLHQSLVNLLFQ